MSEAGTSPSGFLIAKRIRLGRGADRANSPWTRTSRTGLPSASSTPEAASLRLPPGSTFFQDIPRNPPNRISFQFQLSIPSKLVDSLKCGLVGLVGSAG